MSEEKPSEKEIVLVLHSVLYALQDALGEPGNKVLIYTARKIPLILGKFGFSFEKDKGPEENVLKFLSILEETELISDVEFSRIDENTFELKIGKCSLADTKVHEVLKPERVFCPYAIAVASIIREIISEDVVLIESEFTETGSIAKMRAYKYVVV